MFLEHLNASGQSRQRLHGAWRALSGQLASMGTIGLRSVLTPHTQTVTELANELGKTVDIRFDFSDASLSVEAATSLDTALLHLLRNAVSHGLETPEARRRAGKRGEGRIAVRIRLQVEGLEIEVEDDGGGIDFAAIRQRGVERGLITERRAASASEEELVDSLFQPGFSTSPQIKRPVRPRRRARRGPRHAGARGWLDRRPQPSGRGHHVRPPSPADLPDPGGPLLSGRWSGGPPRAACPSGLDARHRPRR